MNTNEKPSYDILNRKLLQFSFHRALTLKSLQNAFFFKTVQKCHPQRQHHETLLQLYVDIIIISVYIDQSSS